MQLGGGEGGGRGVGGGGGGGESAGFAGQSQLPQGIQGIHLSSSQQIALTLQEDTSLTHACSRCEVAFVLHTVISWDCFLVCDWQESWTTADIFTN